MLEDKTKEDKSSIDQDQVNQFKSNVEKKMDETVNNIWAEKAILLEKRLEFKSKFKELDNSFKSLNELDSEMVESFKKRYENSNTEDQFNNFNNEYNNLLNMQNKFVEKMNNIQISSNSFNTRTGEYKNFPKNTNELAMLRSNDYQIPYNKTEEGLYVTESYLKANKEIDSNIDNFTENYYSESDVEAVNKNFYSILADTLKTNKHFEIL